MRLAGLALVAVVVLAGCASPGPEGEVVPPPQLAEVRAVGAACGQCFQPPQVEVARGQQVRWSVEDGHHTVTLEDANATAERDSGDLGPGRLFMVTFATPGTWRYRCVYHSADFTAGMVGRVVVA